VAKEFPQKEGVNFKETCFNLKLVVKFNSIRTMFSITIVEDVNITQFYFCTSFFYSEIEEKSYMTQPLGFKNIKETKKTCRCKAMYGFQYSSIVWNRKFNLFLTKYNLVATTIDGCVYYSILDFHLMLIIFVDDNMTCNIKEDSIEHILSFMNDVFQITIGYPKVCVKLHIIWVREERVIHIN